MSASLTSRRTICPVRQTFALSSLAGRCRIWVPIYTGFTTRPRFSCMPCLTLNTIGIGWRHRVDAIRRGAAAVSISGRSREHRFFPCVSRAGAYERFEQPRPLVSHDCLQSLLIRRGTSTVCCFLIVHHSLALAGTRCCGRREDQAYPAFCATVTLCRSLTGLPRLSFYAGAQTAAAPKLSEHAPDRWTWRPAPA